MFGSKLAAAQAQIASLTAMLASIGFDLKSAEGNPNALKAHLEGIQAKDAKQIADLTASIQTKDTELATANAELKAVEDAFEALGIDLDGTPTADSVKAVLEAFATARATKQVAGAGHEALPLPQEGDTSKSAKELREEFAKITDARARADFYAKHKDKLLS